MLKILTELTHLLLQHDLKPLTALLVCVGLILIATYLLKS